MASFHFQDLLSTGTAAPPALPVPFYCPEVVKIRQIYTEAQSLLPRVWDQLLNEEPGAK